jgi:hypothetical protein
VWETSFQARPQNCETDTHCDWCCCFSYLDSAAEKLIVFEPKQTGGNKRYTGRVGLDKYIQKAGSFPGPCKLRSDKKQYHEDAASQSSAQSNLTNIHPQGCLSNKRLTHKKSGGCKSVSRPKRPKLVSLLVRNIWSVSFPRRVLFQGAQVKTLICILYAWEFYGGGSSARSPLSRIFLNPTCILRSLSISDSWERINILCLYLEWECLCFVPSTASKKLDHYSKANISVGFALYFPRLWTA